MIEITPDLEDFAKYVTKLMGVMRVPRWALTSNWKHYSLWPLLTVWAEKDLSKWEMMKKLIADQEPKHLPFKMVEVETLVAYAKPSDGDIPFIQTHPLKEWVIRTHVVIRGAGKFVQADGVETKFELGSTFYVPSKYNEREVTPSFDEDYNVHLITYWAPEAAPKIWNVIQWTI